MGPRGQVLYDGKGSDYEAKGGENCRPSEDY
jgi:hypothetical protein